MAYPICNNPFIVLLQTFDNLQAIPAALILGEYLHRINRQDIPVNPTSQLADQQVCEIDIHPIVLRMRRLFFTGLHADNRGIIMIHPANPSQKASTFFPRSGWKYPPSKTAKRLL